jgi:hypothetical protein
MLLAAGCNIAGNNNNAIAPVDNKLSFGSEAAGCGNFFVYAISTDKTKVIIVSGDKDKLGVGSNPKHFDVDNQNGNLQVYIDDYKTADNLKKGPTVWYCNDIGKMDGIKPEKIPAKSGKVTISYPSEDKISIQLANVRFEPQSGNELLLQNLNLNDISVGRYPG